MSNDLEQQWLAFRKRIGDCRPLTEAEIEEFYRLKKAQGKLIDLDTCEVFFNYTDVTDPYHVLPGEDYCTRRSFFARNPGSKNAVCFDQIPREILDKLEAKRDAADHEGWRIIYEQNWKSKIDKMTADDFGEDWRQRAHDQGRGRKP